MRASAALLLAVAAVGCSGGGEGALPLGRAERLGILRDLEFFPRSPRLGGPFFLDRFESTRADFAAWQSAIGAVPGGTRASDPIAASLPVVGIDLPTARAFANWRLGRLPRFDEWQHAATGGGLYRRPWGNFDRAAWANTQELGFAGLTPVGAFESGRQPDGPYDLIGNAGEWTETPDPRFLPAPARPDDTVLSSLPIDQRELTLALRAGDLAIRARALARLPGAAVLQPVPGAPWPFAMIVWVDSHSLPRLCAAGWTRPVSAANLAPDHHWATSWWYETLRPRERSSVIGVRVATDPATLVERLTAIEGPLSAVEVVALRTFLRRHEVRTALREVAGRHGAALQRRTPAAAIVREELGA